MKKKNRNRDFSDNVRMIITSSNYASTILAAYLFSLIILLSFLQVIEAKDFFADHDLVYATKNIEEEQGQDNSGTKQTSITSSSSQSTAISSNHSSSGVYAENESTNGDCILLTNEPQQGFLVEVGGTQQHQLLSPRDEEDLAQESFLNEKLKLPSPGVSLLVEYKSSTPSTTQNQCKNSVLTRTNKKSNDPEISSSIKPNKMKKEEEDKEVVSKNKQERMKQYREKCDSLVEEPGRASVSEESHCSSYCYRNNECSICLGSFSEGETVSWSGLDCEHVFHQQCILNWLTTKGQQSLDSRNHNNIIQSQIGRCDSMKCPNCRQDFIRSAKKK